MSLTIYGPSRSRAARVLWMARELGLDFEHDAGFTDGSASPALLAVNPMGQVPVIDDDGFALAESMAINLYLAKKHDRLAPKTLQDEAQTLRWCFWAMTALEKPLLEALLKARGLMGHAKDAVAAQALIASLRKALDVLNGALERSDYLLGDDFTVADLNVASIIAWGRMAGADFAEQPQVAAWLDRCLGREAARPRG